MAVFVGALKLNRRVPKKGSADELRFTEINQDFLHSAEKSRARERLK